MLPPGAVLPDHAGRGLGNVIASACAPFGGLPDALPPLAADVLPPAMLEGVDRVVLVLVDGLGWDQLRAHVEAEPDLGLAEVVRAHAAPITTVAPSTTVAALATLATGVAPLAHGLLGYRMFMPSLGTTINSIRMQPLFGGKSLGDLGVAPDVLLPVPTATEALAERRVASHVLLPAAYTDSPLTRLFYRGSRPEGFVGVGDMGALLRKRLGAMRGTPGLVRVYLDDVDQVAHAYGPTSEEHAATLAEIAFVLKHEVLDRVRDPGTLLLLTADHGHVPIPPACVVPLNAHPELLRDLVFPPTGEGRFAFLHVRDGRREAVRRYVETHLGDAVAVADQEKLVAEGVYGPPERAHPEALARLGDLALVAKGGHRLVYEPTATRGPPALVGHHGGLMPGEMRVPLLAARLG